ncbi:hypothetical protein K402DRAFT_183404 [Aulographum hederae CBS 113979]|uniref:Uncharacterized protein n=1 Tax=Aulographum hederae CBS 113979 TaxID=1176131 RepID=A0A6G1GQ71_9PEZI|nr:hypothetical protein K402DRAFT_183404 [Aulographum hederae CBS 113979]
MGGWGSMAPTDGLGQRGDNKLLEPGRLLVAGAHTENPKFHSPFAANIKWERSETDENSAERVFTAYYVTGRLTATLPLLPPHSPLPLPPSIKPCAPLPAVLPLWPLASPTLPPRPTSLTELANSHRTLRCPASYHYVTVLYLTALPPKLNKYRASPGALFGHTRPSRIVPHFNRTLVPAFCPSLPI